MKYIYECHCGCGDVRIDMGKLRIDISTDETERGVWRCSENPALMVVTVFGVRDVIRELANEA